MGKKKKPYEEIAVGPYVTVRKFDDKFGDGSGHAEVMIGDECIVSNWDLEAAFTTARRVAAQLPESETKRPRILDYLTPEARRLVKQLLE